MTAPLPMGNQKITGLADPTVSTDAVTKNYADTQVASFFSTGDVKFTLKTSADTGWIMFVDGTIGNTGSGATVANPTTLALFTLLYNNIQDALAPVRTSGGVISTRAAQGSASAAWAANCQVQTPAALGRALGVAGAGAGLTTRQLGAAPGAESVTLAAGNIPTITASNGAQSITVTVPGSGANRVPYSANGDLLTFSAAGSGAFVSQYSAANNWAYFTSLTSNNSISTTYTNASPTSFSVMQPTMFLNAMVKL